MLLVNQKPLPVLAGIFTFILSGLGQVYNGDFKKGGVFFLLPYLFLYLFSLTGQQEDFSGLAIAVTILLCFCLFVTGEAFFSAKKIGSVKPHLSRHGVALLLLCILSPFNFYMQFNILGIHFFRISGNGMRPSLTSGDMVIVKKRGIVRYQRHDIVIYLKPVQQEVVMGVGRIVGLEGDKINIRGNALYVNDQSIEEAYADYSETNSLRPNNSLFQETTKFIYRVPSHPLDENFGPTVVPKGEMFLLGDRRAFSIDSRDFGTVESDRILGKVTAIYSKH
jgi:signal peptidase I